MQVCKQGRAGVPDRGGGVAAVWDCGAGGREGEESSRGAGVGVKGWCEARELVRGVAGGEDLPRITSGGGGAGFEKENVRREVGAVGDGSGDFV